MDDYLSNQYPLDIWEFYMSEHSIILTRITCCQNIILSILVLIEDTCFVYWNHTLLTTYQELKECIYTNGITIIWWKLQPIQWRYVWKNWKSPWYGKKDCSSETVLNKYRYLVRWIYERIEKRNNGLKTESRIPISQITRIPSPCIEEHIRKLVHYYKC